MSRATVRAAVKEYFDAPAVDGLLKVRRARPKNWSAAPELRSATLWSTASGYVYIESVTEQRATTGKKYLQYMIGLQLLFRSRHTDAEQAMDDFDTLIEAIKARLRADPHLNTNPDLPGGVFQAGVNLLEDLSDDTADDPLLQSVRAVVRFDASEWITA